MEHEFTDVAVLGLCSGMAIARELARRGVQVTALGRADGIASTYTNQKWKHSGLLYTSRELAQQLWRAYADMDPIERRHLLARDAQFLVNGKQTLRDRVAKWSQWGLPFAPLAAAEIRNAAALGRPQCVGGFRTPDCVIDFPQLLNDLRIDAERLGARVIAGATIKKLIRDGDSVTAIVYEQAGREVLLHCAHCITAMGAWTAEALDAIGVALPIRSWKSNMLILEGEVVEHITCFLYGPGLTLVPYRGHTLIADTRRIPAADGSDRTAVPEWIEALKADIAAYYPNIDWRALRVARVHGCVKTEFTQTGNRNQELVTFGQEQHGVRGLTVSLPGKASLMFELARRVAAEVAGIQVTGRSENAPRSAKRSAVITQNRRFRLGTLRVLQSRSIQTSKLKGARHVKSA